MKPYLNSPHRLLNLKRATYRISKKINSIFRLCYYTHFHFHSSFISRKSCALSDIFNFHLYSHLIVLFFTCNNSPKKLIIKKISINNAGILTYFHQGKKYFINLCNMCWIFFCIPPKIYNSCSLFTFTVINLFYFSSFKCPRIYF